ncbi:hypothetical protein BVY01_01380 [bacterium I07]|nr:hypothetical protein BVY01_01380 [bacterium I07]
MQTMNTEHTAGTGSQIIEQTRNMIEEYRSYLRKTMGARFYKPVFEEGITELMEMIITEFEALVEEHEEWITEAFLIALKRVKEKQHLKGENLP